MPESPPPVFAQPRPLVGDEIHYDGAPPGGAMVRLVVVESWDAGQWLEMRHPDIRAEEEALIRSRCGDRWREVWWVATVRRANGSAILGFTNCVEVAARGGRIVQCHVEA